MLKEKKIFRKYDWVNMKHKFIEGITIDGGRLKYLTLKELAEEYKMDYWYLRLRAAKFGWNKERKLFKQQVQQRAMERAATRLSQIGSTLDYKITDVAKMAIETIRTMFILQNKDFKRLLKGNPELEIEDSHLFNPDTLFKLGKALVDFQKAGRLSLGQLEPPISIENRHTVEFIKEGEAMSDDQRKQFVKIALDYERSVISNDGDENGDGRD